MAGKKSFFQTMKGKKIMGYLYGIGASIVILGALFKILHLPGANIMLIVGLGTEALIFFVSAFEPVHMDLEWERVYPELENDEKGNPVHPEMLNKGAGKKSVTGELDDMLEKAQIEQDLLNRLGTNLGKLGDNIEKMSDVADAASITDEYSAKAKEATTALDEMKMAYNNATAAMSELSGATSDTKEYHEQIQKISKNLGALNSIYEIELQDTENHIKAMNKFYGNLVDAMSSLEHAKQDSMTYQEQMAVLSKNLTSLNNVYGNMLNAMKA